MRDFCRLSCWVLIGLFRSRAALAAEVLVLRHQLSVLQRKSAKRVTLTSIDRLLLVVLYQGGYFPMMRARANASSMRSGVNG
jgi:hypothetical protein